MSDTAVPATAEDLAACLRENAAAGRRIRVCGSSTKDTYGGPLAEADITISVCRLNRLLQYDPRDLTVSVEAGMQWEALEQLLAGHGQMLPLDPPRIQGATVGGVVACNLAGPRRFRFGSARDLIIGMKFATLEGKLVQCGGMVVKNVAGLDMAKLLIGSFGTLAAIASVNFRVHPCAPHTRTFLFSHPDAEPVFEAWARLLASPLQPHAVELTNPQGESLSRRRGWTLALLASGSERVLSRYQQDLADFEALDGTEAADLWDRLRDAAAAHLARAPQGVVVRVGTVLSSLRQAMESLPCPAYSRAGNGVVYGLFDDPGAALSWMNRNREEPWKVVVEAAAEAVKSELPLWPRKDTSFAVMQKIKTLFDPHQLLNRGRLYGAI